MSSYWRDNIAYCLRQGIVRRVSINEMPHKGNYYILPWVTLGGMYAASLPVKIMRISETSDEALIEAAVKMMEYCRLPTLEELEESEIVSCIPSDTVFDEQGFKKIAGFAIGAFDKKPTQSVTLQEMKDGRYCFISYNSTYKVGEFFCDIDSSLADKAKVLRNALNKSI